MNILWWHWLVVGLILIGLELFVPSFTIIWFGIGAVLVGIVMLIAPGYPLESRDLLRTALIEKYFAPELHVGLIEQCLINKEVFQYTQELLEKSRQLRIKEGDDGEQYAPVVRDQAFRRVIVGMYDHRCAVCGIRVLTPDCHTVVDAAHIVPWSLTHNDTVQNGIALCRLCHWTFDEGLITVAASYTVLISKQLSANNNIPSHMLTHSGRGIIGPDEQVLWPDPAALHWHQQHVFRKY